jgi:putative signal transducing protein
VKSSDLIAVSTFASTAEAEIARGVLDAAGIESMIRADNAGGMYPSLAAIQLLVRLEDAENAIAALRGPDASN